MRLEAVGGRVEEDLDEVGLDHAAPEKVGHLQQFDRDICCDIISGHPVMTYITCFTIAARQPRCPSLFLSCMPTAASCEENSEKEDQRRTDTRAVQTYSHIPFHIVI